MHIFTLDLGKRAKYQFVAGLSWEPLVPDSFKKRLVPLAETLRADLYVYRRSDKAMVGFASQAAGAKPNMIPAALVVTEGLSRESSPKNALVALELEEGVFSYIMIRDGFVLAGYDIIGDEQAIRDSFTTDLGSADDWDALICPATWKVKNSAERDFESFLPTKGKSVKIPDYWRLRPIKPSRGKTILKIAIPAIAVYAAYTGFTYWQAARQADAVARAAAEQIQMANAARHMRVSAEPWPSIPGPEQFIAACQAGLSSIDVIVAGWNFGGFNCEGGGLHMTWSRANGRSQISALKAKLPAAVLATDGNSAVMVVPLTISPNPSGEREELPNSTQRIYQLRDYEGRMGIAVDVKGVQPGPKVVEGVPLPWTDFQFALESKLDPDEIVRAIAAPGMRVTKLSGGIQDGLFKYQLQGVQYAKP